MPNTEITYAEQRNREQIMLCRQMLKELPECCTDFILGITHKTSAMTRTAYARDLKLFFHFLHTEIPMFAERPIVELNERDLNRLTATHITLYGEYLSLYIRNDMREETNGDLSKMRKLSALRSFLKFLFKNNKIERNVAQIIDLPKIHDKPILRLEINEVSKILDAAENGSEMLSERQMKWHEHTKVRDLAILSLFLGTGIRVSECVGIDLEDIDFEINGFLVTRKGGNQVILYFPQEVADALKAYMHLRKDIQPLPGHEHALFLSSQRRRITVRATENMVKKYAMIAAPLKKRISPHKLRSTFATNLYNETGDIYLVADALGHSDVNTTRRHYAAMSEEHRRAAARYIKLRDDDPPKDPSNE